MKKSADIDTTGKYRYLLSRKWSSGEKFVNFVLLNPSIADSEIDDPTVKSCIRIATANGFDGLHITNLFAFRATDPSDLKQVDDPVGKNSSAIFVSDFRLGKSWKL